MSSPTSEPCAAQLLAEAGYCRLYVGDHEQALSIFEGLRTALPDHPLPLVALAECHLAGGRHQQAAELAGRAARLPHCDQNLFLLACWVQLKARGLLGDQDGVRRLGECMRAVDSEGAWTTSLLALEKIG